ncbi:MAG: hypothetical protein ACFHVJ_02840 [Aestuariibacter sp.]
MRFEYKAAMTSIHAVFRFCVLLLTGLCINTVYGQERQDTQKVVIWYKSLVETTSMQLLHAAMDITKKEYGDYFIMTSDVMTQGRAFARLDIAGGIDVITAAASPERESRALFLPYPINYGLLGIRLCLILADNQTIFNGVSSRQDWLQKKLLIGQGDHWPDADILAANGFPVVRTPIHKNLFSMLRKKRFDCFPRAISEIKDEFSTFEIDDLQVEREIAIIYQQPLLFWLGKNNDKLYQRLMQGFAAIVESGQYHELVAPRVKSLLDLYQFENRHKIYLENPLLSEEVKAIPQEFWHPVILNQHALANSNH